MRNVIVILAMLSLSACADQVTFQQAIALEEVGFWYGLWHGFIAPFSWVVSLFDSDTAIYAIYNNGGWYDFGFILGIGALAGGSSTAK